MSKAIFNAMLSRAPINIRSTKHFAHLIIRATSKRHYNIKDHELGMPTKYAARSCSSGSM